MVIGDDNIPENYERRRGVFEAAKTNVQPADQDENRLFEPSPWDRLAANVLDLVVLWPIVALVTAPFRRSWVEAQVLGAFQLLLYSFVLGVVVSFVSVLAYQTFLLKFFSATPGKLLFNLRVVSDRRAGGLDPTRLSWESCLLRAIFWIGDFLLVLPLFRILRDPKKGQNRLLHELVSQTFVVSKKSRHRLPFTLAPVEESFFRTTSTIILIFIALMGANGIVWLFSAWRNSGRSLDILTEENVVCARVSEYFSKPDVVRLEGALTLFAAGQINKDCLEKEVRFQLRRGEEDALVYLAMAFVYSADESKSDRYLEKVCEKNKAAPACRFTELISAWSDKTSSIKDSSLDDKLDHPNDLKDFPDYAKVWGFRHFVSKNKADVALEFLSGIESSPHLAAFLSDAWPRVYSKLGMLRELSSSLKLSLSVLDSKAKINLLSSLCFDRVERGCRGQNFCQSLEDNVFQSAEQSVSSEFSVGAETAIALIRYSSCDPGHARVTRWQDYLKPEARGLLSGVLARFEKNEELAREHFKRVSRMGRLGVDDLYLREAERQWIELAHSQSQLDEIAEHLLKGPDFMKVSELGWLLFKRYNTLGNSERAQQWKDLLESKSEISRSPASGAEEP